MVKAFVLGLNRNNEHNSVQTIDVTFTAVTDHPHSGTRKQSLSGRQLPPSGESHPAQRRRMQQDANKVSQQIMHPQYSMYTSLIPIKVWFQT